MLDIWYYVCQFQHERERGVAVAVFDNCDRSNDVLRESSESSGSQGFLIRPLAQDLSFKEKAYATLKRAILAMDVYGRPDPIRLDERELSRQLGVSRTPVREAAVMLEREGLVRIVPRQGILVVRKTKVEINEMIQALAALEGMAAHLVALHARQAQIASLRSLARRLDAAPAPLDHLDEFGAANTAFHDALVRLSGSGVIASMTENLRLHIHAIRHGTSYAHDRAARSFADHIAIVDALEARDAETAGRLARDHALKLAEYVEEHVDLG